MDVDQEILKTLESIEKLLKSSSALTENKKLPNSQVRAQQTSSQRAGKEANKAFKATTTNLTSAKEAVVGLSKSLIGLGGEVEKTTTGFGSLNSQMAKFMASLTPVTAPEGPAPSTDRTSPHLAGWMNVLIGSSATIAAAGAVTNQWLKLIAQNTAAAPAPITVPAPAVTVPAPVVVPAPIPATTPAPPPTPITPTVAPVPAATNSIFGKMLASISKNTTMLGGMASVGSGLSTVLQKLAGDFFMLAQVGLGSTENLFTLSKFALQSGMSLKEYQEVISKNISAASRAGSLENFQKTISAADSQLAELGIFGQASREFQASLAQSNTMMGVRQDDLTDAISAQVKVFDKLRKTTNMTAGEFAGLIKDLSKNEQLQKELVGLAPEQRMARREEFIQLTTVGQRLGLAADASKELADALIKQRSQTVKSRVDQAGRIRQLAQLTGQGGEGERAAQIIMKGRAASAAEIEELRSLVSGIDKAAQGAYETSSFGFQNAIDSFDETLGNTSVGAIMKASRPAELAMESGKVNNVDFGQHVGEFGQFVGQLTTWWRGFEQSIGPGIMAAMGGAFALFFKGPIIRGIQGMLGLGAGAAAGAGAGAAGAAGVLSKLAAPLAGLKNIASSLLVPFTSVISTVKGLGATFMQTRAFLGSGVAAVELALNSVSAIFSGGGALVRGLFGFVGRIGPLAAIFEGVMELFTGKLAEAMDPNGGVWSRIGGVAVAALTAIPQMIISTLELIFGEKFMKPIQSVFDVIRTGVQGAINSFALAIVSLTSWLTDMLPDDSKLKIMVNAAKKSLAESVNANTETINKLGGMSGTLNATGQQTLNEIATATEKKKQAEEAAKKADAATTKATAAQTKFNNVQYGMALDKGALIQDAKTILAQPQVQTAPTVGATTVNKADEAAATAGAKKQETVVAALGGPEILAALNAILGVMQSNLTEEKRQADLTELLVKGTRAAAFFEDSAVVANRVLQHRMTS